MLGAYIKIPWVFEQSWGCKLKKIYSARQGLYGLGRVERVYRSKWFGMSGISVRLGALMTHNQSLEDFKA